MIEDLKLCKGCKLKLVVSEFYFNGKSYSANCKTCIKEKNQATHAEAKRKRMNRDLAKKDLKMCKGCDNIKSVDDFYTCKAYTDAYCKVCNGTTGKGATSTKKKTT